MLGMLDVDTREPPTEKLVQIFRAALAKHEQAVCGENCQVMPVCQCASLARRRILSRVPANMSEIPHAGCLPERSVASGGSSFGIRCLRPQARSFERECV